MTTRTFGDLTFWHRLQPLTIGGGWDPGWRPAGGAFSPNIARADSYWGEVLGRARSAYGDPGMRFNTDDPTQDRYLLFGDGTRVPADGSLAYHDSASGTTYLLNTDGSVSPLGPTGHAGDPIQPAGLRRGADGGWAPIDDTGHQIAPLVATPTAARYGHHDENGVLTPKNAAGDYYVLDPDGGRRFFDRDGHPIDGARFTADGAPGPAATPPTLPTGEQQSGQAAEAVRKLQDELRGDFGTLSAAEERLSEAMLTAHATTVDGRDQLGALQRDIVAAVNDPATALDTPAGQQAYLKFLQGKVAAIRKVVDSGALVAGDQASVATALAGLYADGGGTAGPSDGPSPPPATPAATGDVPASTDPGPADPGPTTADLGPAPAMPDPTLSDVLGGPLGTGGGWAGDPMASLLPGALGGLGGLGGGDPFGLGGLAGAASPLAGLSSGLRDPAVDDDAGHHHDHDEDTTTRHDDPPADTSPDDAPAPKAPPTPPSDEQPDGQPTPQPQGTPGEGAPAASPGPAPVPTSTVALPDGSSTTAKTPALAGAVRAYLSGTAVDEAYRQAGMALPPPGTPVTTPADPADLSCGYLGMFTDHYVVAASAVKAVENGTVVPLSTVASSPNFLGWLDPTTLAAHPAPAPAPPSPTATAEVPVG